MTENRAVELLKYIRETGNGEAPYVGCAQNIAIDMAIQALEEIQQIKEIISTFPLDCGSTVEDIREIYRQLRGYFAIGTIEELQALKEKATPKELDEHNFQDEPHHYLCPVCRSIVSCTQNYCEECGQALET